MSDITLVLQVVTLILWFSASIMIPSPRVNLWYMGWFFLLLSFMVSGLSLHPLHG